MPVYMEMSYTMLLPKIDNVCFKIMTSLRLIWVCHRLWILLVASLKGPEDKHVMQRIVWTSSAPVVFFSLWKGVLVLPPRGCRVPRAGTATRTLGISWPRLNLNVCARKVQNSPPPGDENTLIFSWSGNETCCHPDYNRARLFSQPSPKESRTQAQSCLEPDRGTYNWLQWNTRFKIELTQFKHPLKKRNRKEQHIQSRIPMEQPCLLSSLSETNHGYTHHSPHKARTIFICEHLFHLSNS